MKDQWKKYENNIHESVFEIKQSFLFEGYFLKDQRQKYVKQH